jgi:hypothetical protein
MINFPFVKSNPNVGAKQRGRPKGWHKEGGVFTTIRVSENLKAILDSERKPDERYSDTVERMLYEKAQKIQALTQENDQLKLLQESLKLQHNGVEHE